jgi:hypothetical protein
LPFQELKNRSEITEKAKAADAGPRLLSADSPGTASPIMSSTFPIFTGGPFYRLQERLGLVRGEQRRFGRYVLYVVLFAWVPMAVLAALQGLALGPRPVAGRRA